jgi:hypothetical protein
MSQITCRRFLKQAATSTAFLLVTDAGTNASGWSWISSGCL